MVLLTEGQYAIVLIVACLVISFPEAVENSCLTAMISASPPLYSRVYTLALMVLHGQRSPSVSVRSIGQEIIKFTRQFPQGFLPSPKEKSAQSRKNTMHDPLITFHFFASAVVTGLG